jgi:hypothetical protein
MRALTPLGVSGGVRAATTAPAKRVVTDCGADRPGHVDGPPLEWITRAAMQMCLPRLCITVAPWYGACVAGDFSAVVDLILSDGLCVECIVGETQLDRSRVDGVLAVLERHFVMAGIHECRRCRRWETVYRLTTPSG